MAARHAQHCLSGCRHNNALPGEFFFAQEALAKCKLAMGDHAGAVEHRSEAERHLNAIKDEGFQSYCRGEFTKLGALLGS